MYIYICVYDSFCIVVVHDYPLVPNESIISEVFASASELVVTSESVLSGVFAPACESVVTGESVVSEVFATPGEARPHS